jgi:bacterioferritin-associated ferredoxin
MNDVKQDKTDDLICYCSGTTRGQVKALIDKGVDNLDSISRMTGACSGCGACETSMLEFLAAA